MTQEECPVCGSGPTAVFLKRAAVPVYQNVLLDCVTSATSVARGDLTMAVCERCGFVHNRLFDASLLDYGQSYDNTQQYSPAFKAYVDELIKYLVLEQGIQGCRIVEIGCGKGAFLRGLVEFDGANNRGLGIDPSYEGPLDDLGGRLRFEQRHLGPRGFELPVDVILCRHVIEHIPDPIAFLSEIRRLLVHSPGARLYFETPDIEWILDRRVIWDFFYEHCSLFSARSLEVAFCRAGFVPHTVRRAFDGQYLWLEASLAHDGKAVTDDADDIVDKATQFGLWECRIRTSMRDELIRMNDRGKVAVWGAGAKGVTFASLIDPESRLIDCLVDLNPKKQGCYVPGSGQPIVDYRALQRRGVRSVIVMNPNYREEIALLLAQEGAVAEIVELSGA